MSDVLNVSEVLGKNILNDAVMRDRLPKSVYKKLRKAIENGVELDSSIADVVAHAMKDWAVEKGATHYTHWSQPLTGVTAGKHDFSISAPSDGKVVMEFPGKELIKGELDASPFPSGGLRATFEARGYTVWSYILPAFPRKGAIGVTLCILTSFCSYKEEALDRKALLLRSMQTVNEWAPRILRLFGNTTAKRVAPPVDAEQEYFLADGEKCLQRKDLIYTGRTLFDAVPPKSQELEDHYLGATREGIGSYVSDVNKELWKLGAPARTQHSEVAPAQHELTPIYEGANQAADHNQIVMETLKKVTRRHGIACLLHGKPFVGVNGSNKHDNWSLTADDDTNPLDPGDTPYGNIQFLLVLACIIKAVDIHTDPFREPASDAGNDHRLGANEVPPAIMFISLGEQLEDVIGQLCSTGETIHFKQGGTLKTGVDIPPDLDRDVTDRNYISPFVFTGNKFEFHMVGSPDSTASPNTVLNTIAAEASKEAADMLEKTDDFDMAIHDFIEKTLTVHRRVIFNGNRYPDKWVAEAGRRGLSSTRSMMDAIPALTTDKAVKLFGTFRVFIKAKLESRPEVEYENYSEAISTEVRTMYDMASKSITLAVIKYTTQLAASIGAVKGICQEADVSTQAELSTETSEPFTGIEAALVHLLEAMEKAIAAEGDKGQAVIYRSQAVPAMEAFRVPIDQLEMITDKELWPMPSYGGLIFEV